MASGLGSVHPTACGTVQGARFRDPSSMSQASDPASQSPSCLIAKMRIISHGSQEAWEPRGDDLQKAASCVLASGRCPGEGGSRLSLSSAPSEPQRWKTSFCMVGSSLWIDVQQRSDFYMWRIEERLAFMGIFSGLRSC